MAIYSAIVLDQKSARTLHNWYKYSQYYGMMPDNVDYYGHHSTINLGSLPEKFKSELGKTKTLTVVAFGVSDKCSAVKVEGNDFPTNGIPHITLDVNKAKGGKPKDSNFITHWYKVKSFTLTGTVTEIS